jgi:hypothetical protein
VSLIAALITLKGRLQHEFFQLSACDCRYRSGVASFGDVLGVLGRDNSDHGGDNRDLALLAAKAAKGTAIAWEF